MKTALMIVSGDPQVVWNGFRLGNLMLLSRRKNASLGNLDFADKRTRYFADRVESLPNSQRLLASTAFALTDLETRHQDLLNRLAQSY